MVEDILRFVVWFLVPVCVIIFFIVKIARLIYLDYKLSLLREKVNIQWSYIESGRDIDKIRDMIEYVNVECNKIDGLGIGICKSTIQIEQRLNLCKKSLGFFGGIF